VASKPTAQELRRHQRTVSSLLTWTESYCLPSTFAATLHILRPSPLSTTEDTPCRSDRTNLTQSSQVSSSSVICQTAGPQPLPKRFLHLMRSRASSFKLEYPLLSPRSHSSFLRLLPRRLVNSIRPCIFPSITCVRR
jgi:hypothetical protein